MAITPDNRPSPIATVTLLGNGQTNAQTVTFVQSFLTAFMQNNDQNAVKFLSAKLQTSIQRGQTTLPQLLGVANRPTAIDVTKLSGVRGYNVKAVLHFAEGDRTAYLQAEADADGTLKIIDLLPANF